MPFFTHGGKLRRWVKGSLFLGAAGCGVYYYDKYYLSRVVSRTLSTIYNGALVVYDLKQVQPGAEFDKIHDRVSDRVLKVCQDNGGLYIKMGQQIAGMGHILPPQYAAKFKVLYDDAPTETYEAIEKLFLEEFQQKPDQIFADFDPNPIASASIAQVHKATLKDGRKVAVKIQKPELKAQVNVDLFMYKAIAQVLEWSFKMPVTWSVDYQIEHLKQELDFNNEAKNSERAMKDIQENKQLAKQVYIPEVYWDHSSSRVLTAEWIDGVKFSDIDAMLKTGYNLPNLMNTIVSIFAYQIFYTGFLHCDPHPGNIIVRKNPKSFRKKPQIVLLDHGLYITESPEFRKQYCELWKSLLTMDMKGVRKICDDWGLPDTNSVAMATLAKPFNPNKAVHLDKVSYRDVYEMQRHYKNNLEKMLVDTSKIPLEIVFVGRNLNIVRGNNKFLGSPVNRIRIMGDWAITGLSYHTKNKKGFFPSIQYALSSQINYLRYHTTLFAMSCAFYTYEFWKFVNRKVLRAKYEGDEFDEAWEKQNKERQLKKYGMTMDQSAFNA